MHTFVAADSNTARFTAILLGIFLAFSACSQGSDSTELRIPLLVTAGPEDFISFEIRSPQGEILWRLEAETPSDIPFLVYAVVPEGFRQTQPAQSEPRPLRLGEDLILESRIPDRVFLHRAFASTASTISILESEMHRLESGKRRPPHAPDEPAVAEVEEPY